MAVVLFVAAGLGLIAVSDHLWPRALPAPRNLAGWPGRAAGTGACLLLAAVATGIGWALTRFPGPRDVDIPEQDVSPVLWQAAIGLAALGTVLVVAGFLAAPTGMAADRGDDAEVWAARRVEVLAGASMVVPLLIVGLATPGSELRWWPFVMAAIVGVVPPIVSRWQQ